MDTTVSSLPSHIHSSVGRPASLPVSQSSNEPSHSSWSSFSSQNSTGTQIHHKHLPPPEGIKRAAERGLFREDGRIFTRPSNLTLNEKDNGAAGEDNAGNSELAEEHIKTDANSRDITYAEEVTIPQGSIISGTAPAITVKPCPENLPLPPTKSIHALNGGVNGYDNGQHVTKLGTDEQEREIQTAIQSVQKKKRHWWKRVLGRK